MPHDTTKSTDGQTSNRSEMRHNENGEEILDPTPMQPPLGYRKTLSLSEQIAQQVRIAQLKILEDSAIHESDDEADDFEIGDDFEPLSPHENDHMPTLANLKKKAAEINAAIEKRKLEVAINLYKEKIAKHNTKKEEAAEPPPFDPTN